MLSLPDELIALNNKPDLSHYQKRLKYYARIQLLFIDDFAISRYSEEGIKILYHLIKKRDDFGTSTLFSCQYFHDEWEKQLSYEEGCYGNLTVSADILRQAIRFLQNKNKQQIKKEVKNH